MKLRKFVNWIIGAPSFVWLVVFYAIPMLLVFLIAFKPVDPYGGIGDGLTMKTWFDLRNPSYPSIIWRTRPPSASRFPFPSAISCRA